MKNVFSFFRRGVFSALFMAVAVGSYGQFDIGWTNTSGVSVSTTSISRSSSFSGLHDAWGESTNILKDCEDGWAEADIATLLNWANPPYLDERKSFGFVPGGISSGLNPFYGVQYGVYIRADVPSSPTGYSIFVIDNGVERYVEPNLTNGSAYPYLHVSLNATVRVERTGNQVKYYYDGNLIHFLGGGGTYVTSSTVSISSDWKVGATFFLQSSEWSNTKASFSDKDVCYTERDWLGAGTGSLYHTFLTDNVGIGIKSPARKLDIDGDLRIRGLAQDNSFDRILVSDPSNGDVYYRDISTLPQPLSGSGNANWVPLWTGGNSFGNSRMRYVDSAIVIGDSLWPWHDYSYLFRVIRRAPSTNFKVGVASELFNVATAVSASNDIKAFIGNVQGNYINTGIHIYTARGSNANNLNNYAGIFEAHNANGINRGVWGSASFGTNAYGGFFTAGSGTNNYGIYASVSSTSGTSYAGYFLGAGSSPSNNAAFFNGGVYTVGSNTAVSDHKFKENVLTVENALDKIMRLRPTTYTFKGQNQYPSFHFPTGTQYGFIAQEMEEVIPELVMTGVNPAQYDTAGNLIAEAVEFKGVQYTAMIPVLTAGIQEQQEIIESQNEQIAALEKDVAELKVLVQQLSAGRAAPGPGVNPATGNFNVFPNPTSDQTNVSYSISAPYTNAVVIIYSSTGSKVGEFTLQNAEGQLVINTANLANGAYFCNLVVDGKVAEARQFIVNR